MTGLRLFSEAAKAAATAIAATSFSFPTRAYVDSPFCFYSFSSETTPPSQTTDTSESDAKDSTEDSKDGFNSESLERGAKALREINSSPYHKQVFDVMRQQEKIWLADIAAEKVHFEAIQA